MSGNLNAPATLTPLKESHNPLYMRLGGLTDFLDAVEHREISILIWTYNIYVISNRNSFYSFVTSLLVSVLTGHIQVKNVSTSIFLFFCLLRLMLCFCENYHAMLNTSINYMLFFYYYNTIYLLIHTFFFLNSLKIHKILHKNNIF
jgi:hypothetical protein